MWKFLVVLAGCTFTGAASIGVGQHGVVYGGEAGGGGAGFVVQGGYDTGMIYGRLDGTSRGLRSPFDNSPGAMFDGKVHPTIRAGVGGGFTTSEEGQQLSWHPVAAVGAGMWASPSDQTGQCLQSGDSAARAYSATLELRYAGQLELVFVPRYEYVTSYCQQF